MAPNGFESNPGSCYFDASGRHSISIRIRQLPELLHATWSLLEIARPGHPPEPLGILLVDQETSELALRLRDESDFADLEEQEADYLAALTSDLEAKGLEPRAGGHALA